MQLVDLNGQRSDEAAFPQHRILLSLYVPLFLCKPTGYIDLAPSFVFFLLKYPHPHYCNQSVQAGFVLFKVAAVNILQSF